MWRIPFPVSSTNAHFMGIFQVKFYWFKKTCVPGDLSILCTEYVLLYCWQMTISRQSYEYNSTEFKQLCVLGDLTHEFEFLPEFHWKWLLQDHFQSRILLTWKSFVLGDLNSNHAKSPHLVSSLSTLQFVDHVLSRTLLTRRALY